MPRLALLLAFLLALVAPRCFAAAPPPFVPVHYGHDDLTDILAAHRLRCGTVTNEADFSMAATHGNLADFARDLCQATAAALLGDKRAISLDGYPDDAHGLRELHEGKIDLLLGVTPDGPSALPYDVGFAPTAFFDSQGFLVAKSSGITEPGQLAGKLVCFITDTAQEQRMLDWEQQTGIHFAAHDFSERGEMSAAFEGGRCAAITDDVSELAEMRASFSRPSREFVILPQRMLIDPWAPALRAGQVRLTAVVADVLSALIEAERLGITAANVNGPHPGAELLLGATPGIAATLGMPDFWAVRAISAVGNYGEIFQRDLGRGSDMLLDRGPDALWSQGGMLAATQIR